ncbi:MAG: hypothetical protein KC420_06330 [Myxococcales bacterium]|nr:hypothetical protein [Myxococcales bacterium]MCB9569296.1 hypothetical protein [Myxococcales bacterium]MCB9705893.1 hypothetical protein [Myxococcales bacterium]
MSWIVFIFLVLYGGVRTTLWLRGQLRYLLLRRELPGPPGPLALPAHLPQGLQRLVELSHGTRTSLVDALRSISTVLITDPDVPLGCVRDGRYRVAILTAWSATLQCMRSLDALDESDRLRLESVGCEVDRFRAAVVRLGPSVSVAKRARPLDPFDVPSVRSARGAVEAVLHELERLEGRLGVSPHDPYRA